MRTDMGTLTVPRPAIIVRFKPSKIKDVPPLPASRRNLLRPEAICAATQRYVWSWVKSGSGLLTLEMTRLTQSGHRQCVCRDAKPNCVSDVLKAASAGDSATPRCPI